MLTFRGPIANFASRLRDNKQWRPPVYFLAYEPYNDVRCLAAFADATVVLRSRIGPDFQEVRSLAKQWIRPVRGLTGEEPFADGPTHEIAALKRAGRIARDEQMNDPAQIAEVRQVYAAEITFYARATGRLCRFAAARVELVRTAGNGGLA